ncbi:MAG: alanine--tRNA ligase [Chloroflexota bacterium]|nr:alanine--tRNA ligase [Chloroflexota bacterium]
MRTDEIRQRFLDYFAEKNHLVMPGSSLIPQGDPSVLLTSAGMQQFKDYYLGLADPPRPRIATVQKCLRTDDIDEVGDQSHLTFFEMLGNFAFGDYFKEEAIAFAWELVTERFPFAKDQVWATVFGGQDDLAPDEDAERAWLAVGVPPERIVRYPGWEENWWGPTGDSGPCGPCSEIHLELAPNADGHDCLGPACPCGRFLEIWNLVFNQYYSSVGLSQISADSLTPLDRAGVDTGAGLERWAVALQGVATIFETDLFQPVVQQAAELLGCTYGENNEQDIGIRIICEHTRAAVFLIGDGVLPGNAERSYVVRRLIRRAMRHAYLLGRREPMLAGLGKTVIACMGAAYPDLRSRQDFILRTITQEEEGFLRNISQGLPILNTMLEDVAQAGSAALAGADAFLLHDSYGFPIELTREVAGSRGISVDEEEYQAALREQQERSRQSAQFEIVQNLPVDFAGVTFTGYETTSDTGTVVGIQQGDERTGRLEAGEEGLVVLDRTPFYAEGGGQVGDTGRIESADGVFKVETTYSPQPGLIIHQGKVTAGALETDTSVTATVDAERRANTARNHTATHLLHAALRGLLGDHVQQSGSLVAPDHLRFDFAHPEALTREQIQEVEQRVNAHIQANVPTEVTHLETSEAVAAGALALFGEKYGETVRVLSIGSVSKELCGGTHVSATGTIGLLVIESESSIGAGLRRIEALTGPAAVRHIQQQNALLLDLSNTLETPPQELVDRTAALREEIVQQRRQITRLERGQAGQQVEKLIGSAEEVNGVKLVVGSVDVPNVDTFRELGDRIKDRLGDSGALLLGSVLNDRPQFLIMTTKGLSKRGVHAGNLVREVGKAAGGGGGGSPETAQAGGRDAAKLQEALDSGAELLRVAITGAT